MATAAILCPDPSGACTSAKPAQARKIQAGQTLRQQTNFGEYLARRATEPSYTFRQHLRQIGGAIEEWASRDH